MRRARSGPHSRTLRVFEHCPCAKRSQHYGCRSSLQEDLHAQHSFSCDCHNQASPLAPRQRTYPLLLLAAPLRPGDWETIQMPLTFARRSTRTAAAPSGLYSSLPAAITTAGVRGIFHVAQRAALQSDRGWRIAPSAHFLQHLSQMKPGHGEAWKEQCRIHSL